MLFRQLHHALTGAIMTIGARDREQHPGGELRARAPRARRRRRYRRNRRRFIRFRPVLMTALAMIIGIAPMALSGDQNAPLGRHRPGALFATCATLLFVPVVFSLVHNRENKGNGPEESEYTSSGR